MSKAETKLLILGPYLIGRTRIGRATIAVLAINHSYAVAARQTLIEEGLFPGE